jgi:hypothetical protein
VTPADGPVTETGEASQGQCASQYTLTGALGAAHSVPNRENDMSYRNLRGALLAFAIAALGACGGGGSSSSGAGSTDTTIAVTLSPDPLTATTEIGTGVPVTATATLSPLPVGNVFVVVVFDRPVIQTGALQVTSNPNGSYSATFQTDSTLAVGTYSGTLTLELCKDAQCASEYPLSGATLPYTFTVLDQVKLTATDAAGGAVPTNSAGTEYEVHSGDQVTVTSNTPVRWVASAPDLGGTLTPMATTTTTWIGAITGPATGIGGLSANAVALPADGKHLTFRIN